MIIGNLLIKSKFKNFLTFIKEFIQFLIYFIDIQKNLQNRDLQMQLIWGIRFVKLTLRNY
jgi:hypothetical protein